MTFTDETEECVPTKDEGIHDFLCMFRIRIILLYRSMSFVQQLLGYTKIATIGGSRERVHSFRRKTFRCFDPRLHICLSGFLWTRTEVSVTTQNENNIVIVVNRNNKHNENPSTMTTSISESRDPATSIEAKASPTHHRVKGSPKNAHLNSHSSLRSHTAAFLNTRARATSIGSAPLMIPQSPRAGFRPLSLSPARADPKSAPAFLAPSLLTEPPRISDTQKAMEHVLQQERKRTKEMEQAELSMSTDELRLVLQQERRRMSGYAADLARLKSAAVLCQAESEIHEERCINGLMRQLDSLQLEKGRIIVELEREEEMVRMHGSYGLDA
jgi:hypothetical protein